MPDSQRPFPVKLIPECIHRMLETLHPDWKRDNPNLLTIETILKAHGHELAPENLPRLQQILADKLTVAKLASETATGHTSELKPTRTAKPPLVIMAELMNSTLPKAAEVYLDLNEDAKEKDLIELSGKGRSTIRQRSGPWSGVNRRLVKRGEYRFTNTPKPGHQGNDEGEYSDGPGQDLDGDM